MQYKLNGNNITRDRAEMLLAMYNPPKSLEWYEKEGYRELDINIPHNQINFTPYLMARK